MDQTNIFEYLYPKYQVTKPIRLIELFSGYGSQALALKYLGVPFEHWKTCEWNYKSFQAYKQLHMGEDNTDYSEGKSKEELIDYLFEKGISSNWNEPMKKEQIKRLGEVKLREIYNNIQATHNLVNISEVNGRDLQTNDTSYTYIMTYSFPCQDLSLSGLRKGMDREGNTRSGLLWEVERILYELKENGNLPNILLMENVPQVHGSDNTENFKDWQLSLERLGYTSYWQDLIATDYGIPQIRNRCFMISIYGGYYYNFPLAISLMKRLKDLLEDDVGDDYYLSQEMIDGMRKTKFNSYSYNNNNMTDRDNIKTLTTATGQRAPLFIEIKNATKQGYLAGEIGDGVDISTRMEYHRGTVQKGLSQTLNCGGGGRTKE